MIDRASFNRTLPRGFVRLFLLVALTTALTACSQITGSVSNIPRDPLAECYGDRCFIEDEEFILADQLYSRYGSIHLVERHLRQELEWRNCEVNEALYRLRKVHDLP